MLTKSVPVRDIAGDEAGSIAPLFGLCLIAICGIIGLGLDGGRAMSAYSKAGAALDAAALAATRELIQTGASDADLQDLANRYFEANAEQGGSYIADYQDVEVVVNRGSKTLTVSANIVVPTTFSRVVGFNEFRMRNSSSASFNVKNIELGMALDVTGSMGSPMSKMDALKSASADLIDLLLPDDGSVSDVSIGIAPYSSSVRLPNSLALAASGGASGSCVIERMTSQRYSDNPPTPGHYFSVYAGQSDFDPFEGNGTYTCVNAASMGLTRDKPALLAKISSLSPGGWTSGHLGAQWAWNIVSPNWAGLWPASEEAKAYGTPDLIKAVIFMTDGVFNTSWGNDTSARQAREHCDAMKAQNIIVYTVSFQNPNHPDLQYCASTDPATGEVLYFEADNAAELQQAFRNIAVKLTNLRLSQ